MTAAEETIIELEDVTAGYEGAPLLEHVSFEVETGEIFALLGGSGSGKTTLLRHMIGLVPALSGSIRIDGDEVVGADEETRRRILGKIGVMFQGGALFGSMSLLENVRLPLEEFTDLPRDAMDWIARLKLRLVGLDAAARKRPAELSGGMRKRAAMARAMVLDPKLLFLDEPSAGLDPVTSAELDELIRDLAGSLGITFVLVTHELSSVFAIVDRVALLDRKERGVAAVGTPRELRESDRPRVREFFRRQTSDSAREEAG